MTPSRLRATSEPVKRSPSPLPAPPSADIHAQLHALHADELAFLSQKAIAPPAGELPYHSIAFTIIKQYIRFLWLTWTRALWSTLFLPTNILDRMSIFAFAFFSSIILFFLMVWCLFANIPWVIRRFVEWSKKSADGLSLTNASYPYLFRELSVEQVQAARDALAQPVEDSPNTSTKRVFNLDIAKMLLQCSALMYERRSDNLRRALETTRAERHTHRKVTDIHSSMPGQLLYDIVGGEAAKQISEQLHNNSEEKTMIEFAARLGIKYSTVSELNSQSSAFCGLFYDPNSTWIILVFKGTPPTEFAEWAGDFTYEPREAGHWIRGFGKVHGGFMERIFPRKIAPGARLPYDTIKEGVKTTAKHLLMNKPLGAKVNVWITGHSLGTALASLVYARAINEPREFGTHVVIRDAYLYATPILCDVHSVHSFHNRMNHDIPRTMWRITNGLDAVAVSLPNAGDDQDWALSPYNLFSFAHLGTELKMRSDPDRCLVTGNHFPHGSHVRVESALGYNANVDIPGNADDIAREKLRKLQALPIVGRFVAHGTAAYWDQLQRIRVGSCEWVEE